MSKLLLFKDLVFDDKFDAVFWTIPGESQELSEGFISELQTIDPDLIILSSIKEILTQSEVLDKDKKSLVFIDDVLGSLADSKNKKIFLDLFTRLSHHGKITICSSSQNYFHPSSSLGRTIPRQMSCR